MRKLFFLTALVILMAAGYAFPARAGSFAQFPGSGSGSESGLAVSFGAEPGRYLAAEDGFGSFIINRRTQAGIVAPTTIWTAYRNNKPLADSKFRGRRMDLRGRIKEVVLQGEGAPKVLFAAGPDNKNLVICFLDQEHAGDLEGLETGQSVTFTGTCSGQVGSDIYFRNCRLRAVH